MLPLLLLLLLHCVVVGTCPQIAAMQAGVDARRAHPSGLKLLFTRRYLLQLVVVTVIPAAQQLTGINAIM